METFCLARYLCAAWSRAPTKTPQPLTGVFRKLEKVRRDCGKQSRPLVNSDKGTHGADSKVMLHLDWPDVNSAPPNATKVRPHPKIGGAR